MLFSSSIFLFVFLPLCIVIYFKILKGNRKMQNIFLFIFSILFYAWGEPKFVLIMLLSIFLNWKFGLLVDKYRDEKKKAKLVIVICVTINLMILFIFKYLTFVLTNVNNIFNMDLNIPTIALPIGISFFTFQAISYVIDVYRKNGEVQEKFINVGLYISFFPQLIAGPIVRYETVAYDIEHRVETFEKFSSGVCRFILGLGKKVLLANNLAIVADAAYSQNNISVAFAWLGAIAYMFQIFFDFSGYSDMAIGLGRMFGFQFLENFNYPYISKSVSEFWRRWHISLTTWFKDYIYFPLGGSRVKSKFRLFFNMFVVWFLTGVWHGANWTFILWGLINYIVLVIEKSTKFEKRKKQIPFLRHLYVIILVCLGWVTFRADNIHVAFEYYKSLFGLSKNAFWDAKATLYLKENIFFFIGAIICSTPAIKILNSKIRNKGKLYDCVYVLGMLLIFILSISYIVKGSYNPFIYFNF